MSKPLKFYDVKEKKSFIKSNYKVIWKKVRGVKRKFAIAKAPSGIQAWRIV